MNSIVLQPVSVVSNLGLVIEYICEGSTGATYQWQTTPNASTQFQDVIDANIPSTNSVFNWVPDNYTIRFRCKVTFPDNEILYTNIVGITPGSPQNSGMYDGWYYCERGGMTQAETEYNNEKLMLALISRMGCTVNGAAAVIGNAWAESTSSPGTWENWPQGGAEVTSRGYGLLQWTGAIRTIIPYAEQYFPLQQWRNSMEIQIQRFIYEYNNNIEWVGFGGWASLFSTDPPSEICEKFLRGYLRPTQAEIEASLGNRMAYTLQVYEKYKHLPLIPVFKRITDRGRGKW